MAQHHRAADGGKGGGMIDQVISEVAEGVQTVRFDRPERQNTLTAHMYEAASDALTFGESSSRVRAFLLAGMPGVFTAGHDVNELRGFADAGAMGESAIRFLKTIATVDKPLVAAIDGLAVGIGTVLLLHCDYVVASEWSVFSAPFADIGTSPEAASSLLAPRLMGYHRAFELLVMGEQFDAPRAFQAGLVNRVVPAEDVEAVGMASAQALAAKPPEAVRVARRLLRGDRREVVTRIDQEAGGFTELLRSPAARDALEAYLSRKS
jgi:enoyl-CoA hydratase/carnithine racemase